MSREKNLKPRTIRQAHSVVRGAMGQAIKWDWLGMNPALMASPPVRKHEIHPPSPDAVAELVQAAEQDGPEFPVFLRLAAATGARRGELCALRGLLPSRPSPGGMGAVDVPPSGGRRVATAGAASARGGASLLPWEPRQHGRVPRLDAGRGPGHRQRARQSWRAAYRGLLPDEVLTSLSVSDREQFWSNALTARPPRSGAVVARLAGSIVGFAATGPPLVLADCADPTLGDLYALHLDPDVWRRGIGTQLHGAALNRIRSCGFTHAGLWFATPTSGALGFYFRQGWTDTGRSQLDRGPVGIELHERRLPLRPSDSDTTSTCEVPQRRMRAIPPGLRGAVPAPSVS